MRRFQPDLVLFEAAGTSAGNIPPLMPLDLEYLLRLRRAFGDRVVDFVQAVLAILDDLVHLLLRNEAAVISEPVVGQILSAMVAHLLLLTLPLQFLVPKLEYLRPALLLRQRRPRHRHVRRAVIRAATDYPIAADSRRLLAAIHAPRRVLRLYAPLFLPLSASPFLVPSALGQGANR